MFDWAPVKKLILEKMYKGVLKVEFFNILEVPNKCGFEGGELGHCSGEDGDLGLVDRPSDWRDPCQERPPRATPQSSITKDPTRRTLRADG